MTEKAYGKGKGGKMVNPKGVVGYPFVPAQAREQKEGQEVSLKYRGI